MTTNIVPGAVNMIPVVEIMQRLKYSVDCGGCWSGERRELLSQILERKCDPRLDGLVDAILDNGFTTPICIVLQDWDNDSWMLGNGHHRFTAAILLCLESIPVYFSTDMNFMHSEVTEPEIKWCSGCGSSIGNCICHYCRDCHRYVCVCLQEYKDET